MCALTPKYTIVHEKRRPANTPAEATEAALFLLTHGADPTIATYEGWTSLYALALHCCLDVRGKMADLVTKFIALGVDPETRASLASPARKLTDDDVSVPWGHRLAKAVMRNSSSSMKRMVVQPNLTPLHWAAQRGAVGVVKALLAAGVDVTVLDMNGMSAAAMAFEVKAVPMLAEAADAIVGLLF